MPLYEYQCQSCAHRFEQIQKFSDPPVAECPNCGGPVEKLLSSPAIQFKGSGFYITDYARGKSGSDSGPSAKSTSGDSSSSTAAAGSNTSSTPAAAPSTPSSGAKSD